MTLAEAPSARSARPWLLAVVALVALGAGGCSREPKPRAAPSAARAASGAPAGRLESVSVKDQPGGGAIVELTTSAATVRWRAQLGDAGGVIVELPGLAPASGLAAVGAGKGLVTGVGVRAEREGNQPLARVEVAVRQASTYTVRTDRGKLTLELRPVAAPPAAATPPVAGSRPPGPRPAPTPSRAGAPAATAAAAPAPAPAAAGPPAAAAAVSTSPPAYQIAAGDLLAVEVFGMKELDRRGRVLGDGTLPLPVVGGVPVAGLTPTQAEKAIADSLVRNGLLRSPQVLVVVEESSLRQVSMQGAVRRPGLYPLARPRSLLEMVSEAGGFDTTFDPRQKLLILRRGADGRQQRIEIDGSRLLDYGDPALDALLQPGDVVVAPAAQQLEVYVSGAVQRPGPIKFLSSAGMSVLRALTAAGGPTERARLSNVRIIRRKPDGGQQTITVDVAKVRKGKAEDVLLQDGDTVVVLEWFF